MRRGKPAPASLAGFLFSLAALVVLMGCGGSSTPSVNEIALPVVTVSPSAASVQAGSTILLTATVVSPTTTSINWAVNGIQGGTAALGTITGTSTSPGTASGSVSAVYTAPATVPNPATITIKAISTAETNPFGAALLTITPPSGKANVNVSPSSASIAAGSTLQFSAAVTGIGDTSVAWSVNGAVGGSSVVGTIDSNGAYVAPAIIPSPATVTVTATSTVQTNSSSSAALTITAPTSLVNISPGSTSIWAGSTMQFSATVTGNPSPNIQWSVNNIVGGNTNVGTICTPGAGNCSSPGLYTAPAVAPTTGSGLATANTPATVSITATNLVNGSASGTGVATLTFTPPEVQAIDQTGASIIVGGTSQFTASLSPPGSADVTWWVNGVLGGNSTVGTISSSGQYTAPNSLPSPDTVAITATGEGYTSDSASTPLVLTSANTAPLYVNFGLNGSSGSPNTTHYNGLFTTVSVCLPATPTCQIIPNVLVDTSSVGLRLLNSAFTTFPSTAFGVVSDSAGNHVQECVQFPDTSFTWGPVIIADVVISGEKGSSVPIQVLGGTTFPVPLANCLTLGQGAELDSVAALGANGILGVGPSVQDCGLNCAAGQTFSAYPYYACPLNVCQPVPMPIAQQVSNPVAFFPQDNNGMMITLPSIPAGGAPALPFVNADGSGLIAAGQLVFGVGTQSNNALGSATLYALDPSGNFAQVVYNGNTFDLGGAVDSGAKALYLADSSTLGVPVCPDNPFYCPSSTTAVQLGITGANGASGTVTVNVASADNLFTDNPGFSAFNALALPSLSGSGANLFNLGLPFFFGRTVFVGIAGKAVPINTSAPDGYIAF